MAVQKKKPSMLAQAASEAKKAENEAARLKMKAEMQGGVVETVTVQEPVKKVKAKSKAKTIMERRPLQVSIHFTQEEKYAMEDAKTLAKRLGLADATVEDFVHGLVVRGLESIKGNTELLLEIMKTE